MKTTMMLAVLALTNSSVMGSQSHSFIQKKLEIVQKKLELVQKELEMEQLLMEEGEGSDAQLGAGAYDFDFGYNDFITLDQLNADFVQDYSPDQSYLEFGQNEEDSYDWQT